MKFFIYDNVNEKVILNKEGILLVKEFSDLLEEKVGKEPKGKKSFAFRAFTLGVGNTSVDNIEIASPVGHSRVCFSDEQMNTV